jgi:hypothetical protein
MVKMDNKKLRQWTGILLIIEGLLMIPPLVILGAAINWPASLSEPASVNLPLLLEKAGAVQTGYFIYLLYSILFFVVILLTAKIVSEKREFNGWLKAAAGFAVISTLARCIGIVRWLSVMPVLAKQYVGGSAESQLIISVVYDAINAYGGTIGEALGVGIFAGLSLISLSIAMFENEGNPKWLAVFGVFAGLAVMIQSVELFGIDLGVYISVLVSVLHIWLFAIGIRLLAKPLNNLYLQGS